MQFLNCETNGDVEINGMVIDLRAGDGNRTPEDAGFLAGPLKGEESSDLREINNSLLQLDEGNTFEVSLFSFPDMISVVVNLKRVQSSISGKVNSALTCLKCYHNTRKMAVD